MEIKSSVNLTQLGFFVWLFNHYGKTICASYRTIASQVEGITYEAVRLYLNALEQQGLLTVENRGSRKQKYHLNGDALKRFMSNAD